MWQSHAHVPNLCPPPSIRHVRTRIQTQRSAETTKFCALTLVKRREKNSRTALKYHQFLSKINIATTCCLYHRENKHFPGYLVYLVCILTFTETVLKPLKNTFYNE